MNLSEFDLPGEPECEADGDAICARCQTSGCIENKIRSARAALSLASGEGAL